MSAATTAGPTPCRVAVKRVRARTGSVCGNGGASAEFGEEEPAGRANQRGGVPGKTRGSWAVTGSVAGTGSGEKGRCQKPGIKN